ncbi:BofC C-terminal domain-containing protein [Paenibacillus sp. sgz500958]|uniref:BofC C-terminal domain-containing protein n=1 Tax=Paenibacillus sp. sgz500958 TaxID=3242475 RepID=UPI0036D36152
MRKKLWRRWRRWKRALWVSAACVALTLLAFGGMRVPGELSGLLTHSILRMDEPVRAVWKEGIAENENPALALQREELLQTIRQSGINRTVHLKISYVSGEEVRTLSGIRNPAQMEVLLAERPAWSGYISAEGDLWLENKVEDLSPAVKKEAYIGVDEQGNLTLFKGPPEKEEVLKTFFQMDMGSMKSSVPEHIWKQLRSGIRIQDIEEYDSVLSTFSDYARDTAEEVMQSKE